LRRTSRGCFFGLFLFSVRLEDFFYIDSTEFVWIIAVGSTTGGTETAFRLSNAMPTPHANLIAAFAGIKVAIGNIQFFATKRTQEIRVFHS
jgi:hypothetical protein